MKNYSKKVFLGVILIGALFPLFALAQIGSNNASDQNFQLVPCNGISSTDPTTGAVTTACDYNALITTVQRFINLFLYAAMFIAVILIVFAGFKYLTAGGNTSKTESAKKILYAVVIGMLIAFLSYAVVYYIVVTLKPNGSDTLINSNFGNGASNVVPLKQQ